MELTMFVMVFSVFTGAFVMAQNEWSWSLQTPKERYIAGEPIPARLEMKNIGDSASAVPPAFRSARYYLDGSSKECLPRDLPVPPPPPPPPLPPGSAPPPKREPVLEAPGTIHSREVFITVLCNLEVGRRDLIGRHKFCARPSDNSRESCVEFEIVAPTGIDKEVYDKFPPELRDILEDAGYRSWTKILETYPSSIYAAWAAFNVMNAPDNCEPLRFLKIMDENLWPTRRWVPGATPDNDQLKPQEMLRWEIDWAQRILNEHPDFPYRARLKLLLGVNNIILGNQDVGISWLKEVADGKEEKQAAWAREFLALWKQRK